MLEYFLGIGTDVLSYGLLALSGLIVGMIGKYGNKALETKAAELLDIASKAAVAYAEEKAEEIMKTTNEKVGSSFKAQLAIQFLDATIFPWVKDKYGKKWEEAAKHHIDSAVAKVKGTGATGEKQIVE